MYERFLGRHIQTTRLSGIRKYFDLASEMEDMISLSVRELDFNIPWHAREIAICSIESGKTYYTANQDFLELREEVYLYQKRRFQLSYDPMDNVIVTVGGSETTNITIHVIVNLGDRVILVEPNYVAYIPSVELTDAAPAHIKLEHGDQFRLTPEKLEVAVTPEIKIILMNFPSNPTGGVMTGEDYAKPIPILKEHKIIVVSNEIYARLTYDGTFCSPANFSGTRDQATVISGLSRAYTMTGWRLNYIPVDKTFANAMNEIHQCVIISAPTATQYDAIDTVRNGDIHVTEVRESYMTRGNFIMKSFNHTGLPAHLPHGVLYVSPDIRDTRSISDEFRIQLLEDQHIAYVPGTASDDVGEGFTRISYAYNIDYIHETIERINHFMEKLQQR